MNYDIAEALRKMEEELIQSMKRNLQRHLKEEDAEGFDWAQWQAEKLNSIARYRAQNRHIIGGYISTIPQQIEDMIRQSYETGKQQEEIRILKAIRQGYLAAAGTAGEIGTGFFAVNERKLNALVKATQGEMHKAVSSILRYQDDIYRQTIFRSAAQFNMGGKSLGQAVDAAAQDFLAQGIRNIRYKDGRYVNIASYAEMALRTANLRANIQGEAAKRDEWGICTVKLSAHGSACPKCIPWQGKVYYDDVYGSVPVPKDGKYPLLSTAIAGGALHPNCKNGVHTWFEGINQPPREMTQEEIDEANRRYDLEQQQRYCERNVRKYKRLKLGAIDPENAAKYAAQEQAWRKRLNGLVKENPDVLRMDYRRLKVYDAPTPPAGKTAAVPPTPEPKAAKAKAHTEGVSAGHAVEVTPPVSKDNGGSGKTYSPEKIGGKSLTSGADSGIIKKISGALNPDSERADEHAQRYYAAVRKMKTDVSRIARNTGFSSELVQSIKDFIFMEKHELGDRTDYFDTDYKMAESWQRLIDGKDIKPHDLTLLKHEQMERDLMKQGYSQAEAHKITSKTYNYAKEAYEYYDSIEKHKGES
ncbi:phage minor capsid protein [uncultured Ruminococcus sp.]|uniref:phage minor capsid protein n=1 Tax=uncultured Ruminococcus sp. TaxID=165186 RepID=UPI0025E05C6C|nr:phage minor capsid protein [uncultured Ruminococcus sp.]